MRVSWNFDLHSMFVERDRLIDNRKEEYGLVHIPDYDIESDDKAGRLKIAIKLKMQELGYSYHWKYGFYKSQAPVIIDKPFYFGGDEKF